MHTAEKIVFAIRHHPLLERADRLWNYVRPVYDRITAVAARKGIKRILNGTDQVLLAPRWRMVSESYEPEVWRHLMGGVRPGDVIVDVGAYIGLYTIALAKRVGPTGRVVAFEPDKANFTALSENVALNSMQKRVDLRPLAVGETNGPVNFADRAASDSCVSNIAGPSRATIECVSLDQVFANERVDILKVDVEGYEEKVIQGATDMLRDPLRGPRTIFIEVHPYAWDGLGTTSDSLLSLLRKCNFEVYDLAGKRVERIDEYGEVIAHRVTA